MFKFPEKVYISKKGVILKKNSGKKIWEFDLIKYVQYN